MDNKEKEMNYLAQLEQKRQILLSELMDSKIKIVNPKTNLNNREVRVGEIINEKDVWFSADKPRPIINEEGFEKLVKATGATFPKTVVIEKQSDFNNVTGGQVWIEATVLFPNGELNTDYGVANSMNCQQSISKANMPIMALKRAKSRAFFRSPYINLKVYDESEMSDELSKLLEKYEKQMKQKEEELVRLRNENSISNQKFDKLFNIVKGNVKYSEHLIWEGADVNKMQKIINDPNSELDDLQKYLLMLRIRYLKKLEETNVIQEES